jgi:hypothetical protein
LAQQSALLFDGHRLPDIVEVAQMLANHRIVKSEPLSAGHCFSRLLFI